jgi:hypothetical protein
LDEDECFKQRGEVVYNAIKQATDKSHKAVHGISKISHSVELESYEQRNNKG